MMRNCRAQVFGFGVLAVAASAGLGLVGFFGGSAVAGNWNGPADGWQGYEAGDSQVRFDQCELTDTVHNKFHENNNHDIEPTDITASEFHSCDTVDVRVNDYSFPEPGPGFYECHAFHSTWNCDLGHVHMDTDHPDIPENPGFTLKVLCQEIGHSLGLRHDGSGQSCMVSNDQHLRPHDKDVINGHY
jgi:hypothetical protein